MKVTDEMVERAADASLAANPAQRTVGYKEMRAALTAALADVPEPGAKEPFALTEEERNCKDFIEGTPGHGPLSAMGKVLAEALDRAVRTLAPAQVPGPFVLSKDEADLVMRNRPLGWPVSGLIPIIDRACRTLGPQATPAPTGDVLTAEERVFVESLRGGLYVGNFPIALRIIDRLAPAPVVRTNEELAAEVRKMARNHPEQMDVALETLLRRANGAGK